MAKACTECGKPLFDKNVSGLCREHALAAGRRDPAVKAKRKARLAEAKRSPEQRQRAREARLKLNAERAEDPAWQEMLRESGRKLHAILRSDPRHEAKRKARQLEHQESLLSWCPEEMRPLYRRFRKEMGAAEARRIIEADIAAIEAKRVASLTPLQRQIERIEAGAKLTTKFVPKPAEHDFTLGGIATGMI